MHMKSTGGYVKRSMPRNYKNAGPDAMGVTIERPSDREKEPRSRSKVLPNPVRNVGRGSFNGYGRTPSISGVKAEERAEDNGQC